jgi:hypothetical protein
MNFKPHLRLILLALKYSGLTPTVESFGTLEAGERVENHPIDTEVFRFEVELELRPGLQLKVADATLEVAIVVQRPKSK